MRLFFTFVLIFSVLLLPNISFAAVEFSVGVSPPVIDLGNVSRGSTNIVKFFLVTPSTEPLLVYLQPERGSLDFFSKVQYKNLIFNYSEEDTTSWAELLKNPIELSAGNQTLQTRAGQISGWREVSFLLNIPKNAEPGYHSLTIKPTPTVPSEVLGQAGARVVAITYVTVLFKIPGDAKREGVILDVNSGNYVGNNLEINTFFQNIGTTTITTRLQQSVYKNGTSIANLTSGMAFIKPGETKTLTTFLPTQRLVFGDYNVSTAISYSTDTVSKNSTISVSEHPIVISKPEAFPFWIVVLIIIIIIITFIIYKWSR
jgi:hypothetical protein